MLVISKEIYFTQFFRLPIHGIMSIGNDHFIVDQRAFQFLFLILTIHFFLKGGLDDDHKGAY